MFRRLPCIISEPILSDLPLHLASSCVIIYSYQISSKSVRSDVHEGGTQAGTDSLVIS